LGKSSALSFSAGGSPITALLGGADFVSGTGDGCPEGTPVGSPEAPDVDGGSGGSGSMGATDGKMAAAQVTSTHEPTKTNPSVVATIGARFNKFLSCGRRTYRDSVGTLSQA
jgi:hypothetical protein